MTRSRPRSQPPPAENAHTEAERFRRKARAWLRKLYARAKAGNENAQRTVAELERVRGNSPLTVGDATAWLRLHSARLQLQALMADPDVYPVRVDRYRLEYNAQVRKFRKGN